MYDNGQPLANDAIYHQLHEVVNASQEPGPPIGVLTCEDRDAWAKAYQELTAGEDKRNKCSSEHS